MGHRCNLLGHQKRPIVLRTAHNSGASGFSLIELLVTLVILSLTLSYGISSYREWMQNSQIRAAAESIQIGMQRARAEAVKQNTTVSFVLGAKTSWTVVDSAGVQLDSRSANEGSRNVTTTIAPLGATTLTYDNFGVVVANPPGVGGVVPLQLSRIDLDSSALQSARTLSVIINTAGGSVRICDPNAAVGNPQSC